MGVLIPPTTTTHFSVLHPTTTPRRPRSCAPLPTKHFSVLHVYTTVSTTQRLLTTHDNFHDFLPHPAPLHPNLLPLQAASHALQEVRPQEATSSLQPSGPLHTTPLVVPGLRSRPDPGAKRVPTGLGAHAVFPLPPRPVSNAA